MASVFPFSHVPFSLTAQKKALHALLQYPAEKKTGECSHASDLTPFSRSASSYKKSFSTKRYQNRDKRGANTQARRQRTLFLPPFSFPRQPSQPSALSSTCNNQPPYSLSTFTEKRKPPRKPSPNLFTLPNHHHKQTTTPGPSSNNTHK